MIEVLLVKKDRRLANDGLVVRFAMGSPCSLAGDGTGPICIGAESPLNHSEITLELLFFNLLVPDFAGVVEPKLIWRSVQGSISNSGLDSSEELLWL